MRNQTDTRLNDHGYHCAYSLGALDYMKTDAIDFDKQFKWIITKLERIEKLTQKSSSHLGKCLLYNYKKAIIEGGILDKAKKKKDLNEWVIRFDQLKLNTF